jgi:hypothetical protein
VSEQHDCLYRFQSNHQAIKETVILKLEWVTLTILWKTNEDNKIEIFLETCLEL